MSFTLDSTAILERLRGDKIILRLTACTQLRKQYANVARGEAFAYYVDAEMPLACHIRYRAWYRQEDKQFHYELTQTPFSSWTAEWPAEFEAITSSWGPEWLDLDEPSVFMLKLPSGSIRVNSHPTILTHLARMHGMLLSREGNPYEDVLTRIAARRIDGALRDMGRTWAQTIGL